MDASISHHKAQQARCDQATSAVKALLAERDDLLKEVNGLRSLCQPGTSVPRQARPIDPAVLELLRESDQPHADQSWPCASNLSTGAHLGQTSPPSFSPVPLLPASGGGLSRVLAHHDQSIPQSSPMAYNLAEWAWSSPKMHVDIVPSNPIDNSAFQWSQQPGMSTTTRSKDVDPKYNNGSSYLVSDSASFWKQHPGVRTTKPPEDPHSIDFQYDINPSFQAVDDSLLWPPNIGITPMPESENRNSVSSGQRLQSTNSLISNSETLSI